MSILTRRNAAELGELEATKTYECSDLIFGFWAFGNGNSADANSDHINANPAVNNIITPSGSNRTFLPGTNPLGITHDTFAPGQSIVAIAQTLEASTGQINDAGCELFNSATPANRISFRQEVNGDNHRIWAKVDASLYADATERDFLLSDKVPTGSTVYIAIALNYVEVSIYFNGVKEAVTLVDSTAAITANTFDRLQWQSTGAPTIEIVHLMTESGTISDIDTRISAQWEAIEAGERKLVSDFIYID